MPSLANAVADPAVKPQVVDACVTLIETEVAGKGGLGGMALKTGFKTIRGIRPGFVKHVVDELVPEFAAVLDPMHQEAVEAGTPVRAHFEANASRAADALLAITDGKAERSTNRVVKSAYGKLRGMAKANVESAVPGLADIIEKFAKGRDAARVSARARPAG